MTHRHAPWHRNSQRSGDRGTHWVWHCHPCPAGCCRSWCPCGSPGFRVGILRPVDTAKHTTNQSQSCQTSLWITWFSCKNNLRLQNTQQTNHCHAKPYQANYICTKLHQLCLNQNQKNVSIPINPSSHVSNNLFNLANSPIHRPFSNSQYTHPNSQYTSGVTVNTQTLWQSLHQCSNSQYTNVLTVNTQMF